MPAIHLDSSQLRYLSTASRLRPAQFAAASFGLLALLIALAPQVAAASSSQAPAAPPVADEQAELEALARELAGEGAASSPTAPAGPEPTPASDPRRSGSSAHQAANIFNPVIGATGIFLGGYSSAAVHAPAAGEHGGHLNRLETGFRVQEIEIGISANIDAFFRADLTLAASADEIGFEEAYISTLAVPRTTIRAGQMLANFGRHNRLHTHAMPFLTAPLPWTELLGDHGLLGPGVSVDLLVPLPFYTEINLQGFHGEWTPFEIFDEDHRSAEHEDLRRPEDFAYVGHLKTLFEFGENATLEWGASYLGGRNSAGTWSSVVGGDLTFKWRPRAAARYTSFDWTTEYLWSHAPGAGDRQLDRGGGYTSVRYQFLQRWSLSARGALLGLPATDRARTVRVEALVAFAASEFSAIRLQYAHQAERKRDPIHEVFLQFVFTLGAHPSHAY